MLEDFLNQIVIVTGDSSLRFYYDDSNEHSFTEKNLKDIIGGFYFRHGDEVRSEFALSIESDSGQRFIEAYFNKYGSELKHFPSLLMDKNGYYKYAKSAIGDERFSNESSYSLFSDYEGRYRSYRVEDYCAVDFSEEGYMGPELGNLINVELISTDKWRLEYELIDSHGGNFFGYELRYRMSSDGFIDAARLIGKANFTVVQNEESIFDGFSVQSFSFDYVEEEPSRDVVVRDAFKRFLNDEVGVVRLSCSMYRINKYGFSEDKWRGGYWRFSELFSWMIEEHGKPSAYLYDVDNDDELELLIDDVNGYTIIDCRGDKLYLLDESDGTASACSIYRNQITGIVYVGHSDFTHGGRQWLDLTEYDGSGNIVDSTMSINADYWENENDYGTDKADYSFNGNVISYDEYIKLRELYAEVNPEEFEIIDYHNPRFRDE